MQKPWRVWRKSDLFVATQKRKREISKIEICGSLLKCVVDVEGDKKVRKSEKKVRIQASALGSALAPALGIRPFRL